MSTNISIKGSDDSFIYPEVALARPVRFWLIIFLNTPSILCSLCVIFHILIDRTQRHALYSHTIFLILVFNLPVQLVDVSLYLFVLSNNIVQPSTPAVCLLWLFIDNGVYAIGVVLLTWFAIERYILIFHDRWLINQRGRLLFHYLPLTIIITYFFLFYVIGVFFLPCENDYNYSSLYCGVYPCLEYYYFLSIWEAIVHYFIPVVLESLVSAIVLIRVLWQKRRLRQSIQWRKQRRMILQLVLISGINIPLNLPLYIIYIAETFGLSIESSIEPRLWFFFFSYLVIFSFPFASLCQFPVLRKQMKKILCFMMARPPRHVATVIPAGRMAPIDRPM